MGRVWHQRQLEQLQLDTMSQYTKEEEEEEEESGEKKERKKYKKYIRENIYRGRMPAGLATVTAARGLFTL
jgi:hypothetical protein